MVMAQADLYTKIAQLSLNHFDALPKTGKPITDEWTVLSTIVQEGPNDISVVALGTGSKCIGSTKMCANGTVLNDSHAEVVCRRAFLRYLYNEMDNSNSNVLTFHEDSKKFKLKGGLKFHFFTTHVPCGDAAIFPKQNSEDFGECIKNEKNSKGAQSKCDREKEPSPKRHKTTHAENDIFRTGAKCVPNDLHDSLEPGLSYHITGVVRTKPGRGDPTLSVSCSDKIAVWCHLGLQGALLLILLEKPVFLESFIIAGNTQFDVNAAKRAFWERIGKIDSLAAHFLKIQQVEEEFKFAKCDDKRPACASIIYTENCKIEIAVDGKKQGVTKKNMKSKSAVLSISKLFLFKMFLDVTSKYNIPISNINPVEELTYDLAKSTTYYSSQKDLLINQGFNTWVLKDKNLLNFTK